MKKSVLLNALKNLEKFDSIVINVSDNMMILIGYSLQFSEIGISILTEKVEMDDCFGELDEISSSIKVLEDKINMFYDDNENIIVIEDSDTKLTFPLKIVNPDFESHIKVYIDIVESSAESTINNIVERGNNSEMKILTHFSLKSNVSNKITSLSENSSKTSITFFTKGGMILVNMEGKKGFETTISKTDVEFKKCIPLNYFSISKLFNDSEFYILNKEDNPIIIYNKTDDIIFYLFIQTLINDNENKEVKEKKSKKK